MFDDIQKPMNATEWYELGLKHGIKLQHPQSAWILNDQKRFVCRNCGYDCGYDAHRGFIMGSFCASCGAKMEEMKDGKRS